LPDGTFSYTAEETKLARLAWCYGDLGTATALVHASRELADDSLRLRSIRLAINAASQSAESGRVRWDRLLLLDL